jgi:hypothetical protein
MVQAITIFLWWLIASGAVSLAAKKRGYGQGEWFWLSLFLSPIFTVILLNAYPVKVISEEVGSGDGLSITPPTDADRSWNATRKSVPPNATV